MKHIIFGATGFIGRHVVTELAHSGRDVLAVVRSSSDTRYLEHQHIPYIKEYDFTEASLTQLLQGYDYVYNCTANVHPHQSLQQYNRVQVTLAENISRAAAAAGCKRMIQLSSVEVYGQFAEHPMQEDYPCRPLYDFQLSLLQREQALLKVVEQTGLDLVMLRPAATFGPGSPFTDMIVQAHQGKRFPVIGKGDKVSSGVDTRDIGRAMLFLAEHPKAGGTIVNLQAYEYSMQRLKEGLDKLSGIEAKYQRLPLPIAKLLARVLEKIIPYGKLPFLTPFIVHASTQSLRINDDKIRALGFQPHYTLEDSLSALLAAQNTNPADARQEQGEYA